MLDMKQHKIYAANVWCTIYCH